MNPSDPTDPAVSAQRARYRGKVKTGWRHHLGEFLRESEWLWAAVFLLIVFAILTRQFRVQPPPSLPLGAVASKDIRAPFDLQIVDKVATAQKQIEARSKVLPVYDWNSGLADDINNRVSATFETARSNQAEFEKFLKSQPMDRAKTKGAEEEFLGRLSDAMGGNLSRFALRQFQRDSFSLNLERTIQDLVTRVEKRKIVPNGEQYQNASAIFIRDIQRKGSGWTQNDPATSDIISYSDAKRLPGSMVEDLLNLPAPLRGAIEEYTRNLIQPNLTFNSQETNLRRERAAAQVEPLVVFLKRGQVLLKAGDKVDESALQKIEAFQQASQAVINIPMLAALFFLLVLLLTFTFMYLKTYRKQKRP